MIEDPVPVVELKVHEDKTAKKESGADGDNENEGGSEDDSSDEGEEEEQEQDDEEQPGKKVEEVRIRKRK